MYPWQKEEFNIMQQQGMTNIKVAKESHRYFMATGLLKKQKIIFKSTLPHFELKYNIIKLSKEVFFLNNVSNSQNPILQKHVPQIINYKINKNRAWYIQEYVQGKLHNINNSNFLFKKTFFNSNNLRHLIIFFSELSKHNHLLTKNIKQFKGPKKYVTTLAREFYWNDCCRFLNQPTTNKTKQTLCKYGHVLENSQKVICHFEPYPPHIITTKNNLKIIDWENVSFSSQVQDVVILWIRSYSSPGWQKKLYGEFAKTKNTNNFKTIWDIELLIQLIGNIRYFNFTEHPDELKHKNEIINFLITTLNETLKKYK